MSKRRRGYYDEIFNLRFFIICFVRGTAAEFFFLLKIFRVENSAGAPMISVHGSAKHFSRCVEMQFFKNLGGDLNEIQFEKIEFIRRAGYY